MTSTIHRFRSSRLDGVVRGASALAIALWLASVPAVGQTPEVNSGQSSVLRLAAGRRTGNYAAVAEALKKELARVGREIEVQSTEGSSENVQRIRQGQADLALLQSDVAYFEHFKERPFQALASVCTEPIHILAYRGLDLHRLSDLTSSQQTFRAAIGAQGSGSSPHAAAVLEVLGLPPARLSTAFLSIDDADPQLRSRDLDLAFVTSALPSSAVQSLAEGRIVSLLEIDRDFAQELRKYNPFFVATEIPYATYGLSKSNIPTLGTRMLLVGRPTLSDEDVHQVLTALYSVAQQATDESLPFLRELTHQKALRNLSIPAHPAARTYHQENTKDLLINRLRGGVIPVVLFVVALLVLARLSRFAYFIHQFVLGRVLLSLVTVWLFGSIAMYLLEGKKNQAFRSLGDSAIAILHYLFSGLESKYPVTPWGHVVAILVLSLGVGIVTLFTATLVTVLVEHALNIRTLRTKPSPFLKLSDHTVIAGWSDRTKRLIRQLRSPDLRRRPKIVVIAPKAAETTVEDRGSFRGVWVVEGDRAQSATLAKADIDTASSAIILSSNSAAVGSDLSSISCAHAMQRLSPDLYRIVEARRPATVEHLQRNRVDEVIDTATLCERLISQSTISPGITEVFDELLSFGEGSQEIYILPVNQRFDGLSFRQIRSRLVDCEAILLGYWRHDHASAHLNPRGMEAEAPLDAGGANGDKLVILADSPKALTSLRIRLKQWRLEMTASAEPPKSDVTGESPVSPTERAGHGEPPHREVRIGICGWNDEAKSVIRNLHDAVDATHQEFKVTVIDDPATSHPKVECSRNVRFVFGDPTHSVVLENAGVESMERLVILADRTDVEDDQASDHRSLVICLAAKEVNPDIHLIVEVLHSENKEHFERIAGAEIVSVEDLSERLLAQSVISPGITGVFLELFTATEDSNELYLVPTPEHWVGKSFDQVATDLHNGHWPAIALGYRIRTAKGDASIILNPSHRKAERRGVVDWREYTLRSHDDLVIMANQEPTW